MKYFKIFLTACFFISSFSTALATNYYSCCKPRIDYKHSIPLKDGYCRVFIFTGGPGTNCGKFYEKGNLSSEQMLTGAIYVGGNPDALTCQNAAQTFVIGSALFMDSDAGVSCYYSNLTGYNGGVLGPVQTYDNSAWTDSPCGGGNVQYKCRVASQN